MEGRTPLLISTLRYWVKTDDNGAAPLPTNVAPYAARVSMQNSTKCTICSTIAPLVHAAALAAIVLRCERSGLQLVVVKCLRHGEFLSLL